MLIEPLCFATVSETKSCDSANRLIPHDVPLYADTRNHNHHPIRRKAQEIAQKLPLWDDCIEFLHDRKGYVGVRRAIIGSDKFALRPQILLAASVYVRHLNCTHCDAVMLADCIAEYCLAKKALREIGLDPASWRKLLEETSETDC